MNRNLLDFVNLWVEIDEIIAGALILFAIVFMIIYYSRLNGIKSMPEKYSFVIKQERKFLWYSSLSVTIAIVLLFNALVTSLVQITAAREVYFIAFISLIVGVALSYTLWAIINYYYPFYQEKKLKEIRFKPRISPETGKELRLLNEDEEDVHMTPEMIAEEESFTYDYDVWLDDETGFKLIEKYEGHLHASICDQCHFRTLKDYKEEIIQQPTEDMSGIVKKYYKCTYCGHKENKMVNVSPLQAT